MKALVLASRNAKKAAELAEILADLKVGVRTLDDFPQIGEIEEPYDTFTQNAAHKAETVAAAAGLPALADDSGLLVDALGGAPGVYSARFAEMEEGFDASGYSQDAANNALLLEKLNGVPESGRGAHYECAVALAVPGRPTEIFTGRTDGRILPAPRGEGGFGYDPLFFSADLGESFGTADAAAKHAVSHRGRALARFKAWLESGDGDLPNGQDTHS